MKSFYLKTIPLKDGDKLLTIFGDATCITIKMDGWGFNDLHLIGYTRKSVLGFLALWARNQAGVWGKTPYPKEITDIIGYLRYRRYRDDF